MLTRALLSERGKSHAGMQRESEVKFIILQLDNLQLILGLNAIPYGGFLDLLLRFVSR